MLTPSNTATNYRVMYSDPDTGHTYTWNVEEGPPPDIRKKMYEKKIAPGAGDPSTVKIAPGAGAPSSDKIAPGARDPSSVKIAPPPQGSSDVVKAPGASVVVGHEIALMFAGSDGAV